MSDHDFQTMIIAKLTDLATGQATIAADLKALKENSEKVAETVADHDRELNERRNQCPLVDDMENRVRNVEDFVIAQKAVEKADKKWSDHIWPVVRYVAGVVLSVVAILAMNHASLFSFIKEVSQR